MSIIAIMGAVLIFVGVAWLIAKNWHQIPDIVKVVILVFSTLLAFVLGVVLKSNNYDGSGRGLIALGALLYVLSLFLISQIYHLANSTQNYSWLLFFAWTIIMLTAYLLHSPENIIISLIVFFNWAILQYFSSISGSDSINNGGLVLGISLIFLSAGTLLYGLSVLHNSIKHKFTNIYRFWTVFYFLLIFYTLSFQMVLPILAEYSFEAGMFSIFLILFILTSFLSLIIGLLVASSKRSISIKETGIFIVVMILLFVLILSTKIGAGQMGACYAVQCYNLESASKCNNPPGNLVCKWQSSSNAKGYCQDINCYSFGNESACNSAPAKLKCEWNNNYCNQKTILVEGFRDNEKCLNYQNQKTNCLEQKECDWRPGSSSLYNSRGLPTGLWLLWMVVNFIFIGFIVLVLGYGQEVGSSKIINLGILFFVVEIVTRYIGFWFDFRGYVAFGILAILGGIMLILGAWLIPKWRRGLLENTSKEGIVVE